ncbi:hypothetical protein BH24ACI3_BH24ACI3_00040 [soil metagenome]
MFKALSQMRKTKIAAAIFFVALALLPAPFFADEKVAVVRHTIPEFRDISIWKMRPGLTRFSPDGRFLAVSGKKADVVIYDTETGEVVSTVDGQPFTAFSFSPDGRHMIGQRSLDHALFIYETETGRLLREIRGMGRTSSLSKAMGGSGIVNQINGIFPLWYPEMGQAPVSGDWKNVLINKNDREFAIADFTTGEHRFDLDHANFNAGLEKAKIGLAIFGLLAGAGNAGFFLLGSASNPQFSAGGKYLLITSGNKNPTLWNLENGELMSKFTSDSRIFYSRFSQDEAKVATSDFDGITRIWDTASGDEIASIGSKREKGVIAGWNSSGTAVLIHPNGKGDLQAFDPTTGKLLYSFAGSTPGGTILSDDSSMVVTVPKKNKNILFQIWDANTGELLGTVPRTKKQKPIISFKWHPNNTMIAATDGIKKNIHVWNSRGQHLMELSNTSMPMQFSQNGRLLATGGVLANTKTDTGYIWEFFTTPPPERLGQNFVRR